jgi:hypothetical protein
MIFLYSLNIIRWYQFSWFVPWILEFVVLNTGTYNEWTSSISLDLNFRGFSNNEIHKIQCLRLSTCSIFVCFQGYFMRPAVITDVKDDSRLIQEEIFGPVTCVLPESQ